MGLFFEEYRTSKIVNIHRHTDGPWFWDKYSASPYTGCRSGCEFCYCRGSKYGSTPDPAQFDSHIRVKINAFEQLKGELFGLPPAIISVGDWQQPAEERYLLSRKMLEVVLEAGFPILIVERSPLVTRDVDLLVDIQSRSWAGVLFSISTLDRDLKQAFEPRSPSVKKRLEAMRTLADAGIITGTALMPVIPCLGDDIPTLEAVISATRDHGGSCVVAGGMSMNGAQAQRTLVAAGRMDPGADDRIRKLYATNGEGKLSSSPPAAYRAELGRNVRELCNHYHIRDRMPRYIVPGPLAINHRIAEKLFLQTYHLTLDHAPAYRIWAYRKAAWSVDEHPVNLLSVYKNTGISGISAVPDVGPGISKKIVHWLELENSSREEL